MSYLVTLPARSIKIIAAASLALLLLVVSVSSAGAVQAPLLANNYYQGCAIDDTGQVYCSGSNIHGGLGIGTSVGLATTYAVVPGLSDAVGIAASEEAVCAVHRDTTVSCWGFNGKKQAGQGDSTDDVLSPQKVAGLTGVVQISGQSAFFCALLQDKTIRCWGAGSYGVLGDGGSDDKGVPVQSQGIAGAKKVSAGDTHTCALLEDSTIRCWGFGSTGALGDGASANSTTPVVVSGISDAVDVGAGREFSCALRVDRTVWCWGIDYDGQLGNDAAYAGSPTPVQVQGLDNVRSLAVGYSTSCALKFDRTVWCWGYASEGQIGDGLDDSARPTGNKQPVPAQATGAAGAIALAPQPDYTVCAMYPGGTVKCWGYNELGVPGIGSTAPSNLWAPADAVGLKLVTQRHDASLTVVKSGTPRTDRKKKNYIVSIGVKPEFPDYLELATACTGSVKVSTSWKVTKIVRKKGKRVKKKVTKKISRNAKLAVQGFDCVGTASLKLPVKTFGRKTVKFTATLPQNAAVNAASGSVKQKMPKVKKSKKKK